MALVHDCSEIYQVVDEREGTVLCTNCGRVLEAQVFFDSVQLTKDLEPSFKNDDAKEVLSRLNLNETVITCNKDKIDVKHLYKIINDSSAVSLKEFCAATGIKKTSVVKSNRSKICSVDIFILLDKYCAMLDINFSDYTLIKEKIRNIPYSGHPPLTIIGYFIYEVCKRNKNITIKKICETLGISSISIQRFRKHEFSCGSKISKG